jgi:hypothetical protein
VIPGQLVSSSRRDLEPDTLANDPATRAPSLPVRRPTRVIRQFAPSSRGVPLPVLELALPGRATQVFPRSSPDGAPGVRSLRRFAPADGWTRLDCSGRLNEFVVRLRCRTRNSLFSTAFLPVRAHVSFVPPRSAPIDFRRGDRPPVGENEICKSDRPRMGWRRLLGFDSRLRSVSPAYV